MIAIIDYRAGNLTSVRLALEYLDVDCLITSDPNAIESAERVIFPGVGAAGSAMANLREMGLVDVIKRVAGSGRPFMGICLGTQIILGHSAEDGGVECLGLVPGDVKRFSPPDSSYKIPQMGWNKATFNKDHPVFSGIDSESEFYFVHSYYPAPEIDSHVYATTDYAGVDFASVIGHDNIIASQFHPERSGRVGLKMLANFARWDGKC